MSSNTGIDISGSIVQRGRTARRSVPGHLQSEGLQLQMTQPKNLASTRYHEQDKSLTAGNKRALEAASLYSDGDLRGSPMAYLSRTDGDCGKDPVGSHILGCRRPEDETNVDSDQSGVYFRKRAPRASQACNACRAAKSKCDEMLRCANCVLKNIECSREAPQLKAKTISNQPDISTRLDQIIQSQETFQRALIKILPTLERQLNLEKKTVEEAARVEYDIRQLERTSIMSAPARPDTRLSTSVQESNSAYWDDHGEGARKQVPFLRSMPTIPPDHTTGWARILEWPAVTDIIGNRMRSEGLSFDPLKQEIEFGLLYPKEECLNSNFALRYEEQDRNEGGESPWTSEVQSGHHGFRDRLSDEYEREREGLKSDDSFDLGILYVQRLTDCFLSKIAVMHPIVAPRQLSLLVNEFRTVLPNVGMMLSGARASPRSDGSAKKGVSNEKWPRSAYRYVAPWDVHESLNIAIVLLILALGEVCEDVTGTGSAAGGSEWQSTRSTSAMCSGHGPQSRSDRLSLGTPRFSYFRNASSNEQSEHQSNRVPSPGVKHTWGGSSQPGFAFFEAATALMASHVYGNTLEQVQANLLTGLYYGQFARILESHTHYFNASRALYVLLNPRRAHIEALAATNQQLSDEDNQLVIIFWTCLQLESDILAELDLPQSPILAWESTMPWPDLEMAVTMGHDLQNMECYIALLWLRRRLNNIHAELYGPGIQEGYSLSHMNHLVRLPFIDSLRESLEGSNLIAHSWAWSSNDPPAQNILAARLRAKYYGGLVIIYRPFLRMVLNNENKDIPQIADDASSDPISALIIRYAGNCVDALIESTQAFQNVHGCRPLVTNPWGTAYAQFGNVLLLLAVYQNGSLRKFVELECLKDLSIRTLRFLDNVAQSSPALRNAHRVLEIAVSKVVFLAE
ncbi:hypothetical protein V1505DRAFT_20857 [Lipomyces doorenjongii]